MYDKKFLHSEDFFQMQQATLPWHYQADLFANIKQQGLPATGSSWDRIPINIYKVPLQPHTLRQKKSKYMEKILTQG